MRSSRMAQAGAERAHLVMWHTAFCLHSGARPGSSSSSERLPNSLLTKLCNLQSPFWHSQWELKIVHHESDVISVFPTTGKRLDGQSAVHMQATCASLEDRTSLLCLVVNSLSIKIKFFQKINSQQKTVCKKNPA